MDTHFSKSTSRASNPITPTTEKFVFNKELNAEFLEKSYGHNLDFGKKMFAIFLSTIEQDMSELSQYLKTNDYSGMHAVAHKSKNNFTWVGLPLLSGVMYKLEAAAKAESVSVVSYYDEFTDMYGSALELVKNEYNRILNYLS